MKPVFQSMVSLLIVILLGCGQADGGDPTTTAPQAVHRSGAGTGAFGVFYEPCAGNVDPYHHLSHYVFWDRDGQVVLLGNTSTTLAPDLAQFDPAAPREDAVTFVEFGNDVTCRHHDKQCHDTQNVRYLPGGQAAAIPLDWTIQPIDDLMDAVQFSIPSTPVLITCSSMRVVGPKCLQVTQRLRELAVQLATDYGGIVIDDAACAE